MTELSFLIDLLLNHKLSKEVKKLIADRVREIESAPRTAAHIPAGVPPHLVGQSPSTIANLMKDPPAAPAVVATTPIAASAIASRQAAIAAQLSGKPEPGRTSPRKY